MACCCTKTLELCHVSVCGTDNIQTGAQAPSSGIFKLVLDYLDVQVIIEAAFQEGNDMNFPSTDLNEKYRYKGIILGPGDEPITLTKDEIVYDCISFQTGVAYSLNKLNCPNPVDPLWTIPPGIVNVPYFAQLTIPGDGPYAMGIYSSPGEWTTTLSGNVITIQGTVTTEQSGTFSLAVANCGNEIPGLSNFDYPFSITE